MIHIIYCRFSKVNRTSTCDFSAQALTQQLDQSWIGTIISTGTQWCHLLCDTTCTHTASIQIAVTSASPSKPEVLYFLVSLLINKMISSPIILANHHTFLGIILMIISASWQRVMISEGSKWWCHRLEVAEKEHESDNLILRRSSAGKYKDSRVQEQGRGSKDDQGVN